MYPLSRFRGCFPTLRTSLPAALALLFASLSSATCSAQVTYLSAQQPVPIGAITQIGGIASDSAGDLFVSDSASGDLWMVPVSATSFNAPVLIAQSLGQTGSLAVDRLGNVFSADLGSGSIYEVASHSGAYQSPVLVAQSLGTIAGVAVDQLDNLFVSDSAGNRVLMVPYQSGIYANPVTIASAVTAPQGIAVDQNRNLFVAVPSSVGIDRIPWTGNGYGTATRFEGTATPLSVLVDNFDNLTISQTTSHDIENCAWNPGANRYNTCSILSGSLAAVGPLAFAKTGGYYVADLALNQVLLVSTARVSFPSEPVGQTSSPITFNFAIAVGTQFGTPQTLNGSLSTPEFGQTTPVGCPAQTYTTLTYCGISVTFTPQLPGVRRGALELTDASGNVLYTTYFMGTGIGPLPIFTQPLTTVIASDITSPTAIGIDPSGSVYVADTDNNQVLPFNYQSGSYTPAPPIQYYGFVQPAGIFAGLNGAIFLASTANDRVYQITSNPDGTTTNKFLKASLNSPAAIVQDAWGNLLTANSYGNFVGKLAWTGTGFLPSSSAETKFPVAVTYDALGNAYTVDPYSPYIACTTIPLTSFNYFACNPALARITVTDPTGLLMDGMGNLFVLEGSRGVLLLYLWNGNSFANPITLAANLNNPQGIAMDAQENLYIADTGNHRVLKLALTQPAIASLPTVSLGVTGNAPSWTLSLANLGNAPFAISTLAYPQDFPQLPVSTACSASLSLPQGSACSLSFSFLPTVAGNPLTESIQLSESDGATLQSVQTIIATGISQQRQTQSISLNLPTQTSYGVGTIPIPATSTSGLPVTVQRVSGPGTLDSSGTHLTVTGVGVITLKASQPGNNTWQPAAVVTQTITVTPATLTVTPADTQAVYGTLPSTYAYSISGFAGSDSEASSLTGAPQFTLRAPAKPGVGSYPIQAAIGTLHSTNYTFNFVPGTLTITPAPLAVAVNPATLVYGSLPVGFTFTATGFVNGDTPSVLTGAPFIYTGQGRYANVGVYPLLIDSGTLAAANYTLSFTPSTLTIIPAPLTIAVVNTSISTGAVLPSFAATLSGFLNNDGPSVVTGTPIFSTTATALSPAGVYPVNVSAATLHAANYTFQCVPGTLTINDIPLAVKPRGGNPGSTSGPSSGNSSSGNSNSGNTGSTPATDNGSLPTLTPIFSNAISGHGPVQPPARTYPGSFPLMIMPAPTSLAVASLGSLTLPQLGVAAQPEPTPSLDLAPDFAPNPQPDPEIAPASDSSSDPKSPQS